MPAAKRAHTTTLSIVNTTIRNDAEGRYSLNDCWKAAGGQKKDQPSEWVSNTKTIELMATLEGDREIPVTSMNIIKTGPNNHRGIWACKELVYAYAMWISPAFHLRVIRAFDAMMQGQALPSPVDMVAAHKQAAAIFRSLNHVGKLTGMSREDAARAASAAAREHTGVDVLGELHNGLIASAAKNDAVVAVMATRPKKALTEDDIAEGISCAIRVLSQLRTGSAQANIAEREQDLKMAGHAVMQMWDDVQRLKQERQGHIP
ncbi:MAG: KilA-N domain-containing protein [Komagataeibacter hansenii]|nr:KilA-N domain-containing protein [Novacetimonas hansenii]